MLVVSKANLILGAIALVAIGGTFVGFTYAVATDECSRAPDGTFHWDLLEEGFAHVLDSDAECDPWQVVAPDPDLISITIGFTDGWTFEESRKVRIESDGAILVLEPADEVGIELREVARGDNPALAKELLGSLSRYTRYNRVVAERLEGADLSDPQTYLAAPIIRCTGDIADGRSISVQFDLRLRANQAFMYDSSCSSIAQSLANRAFNEAHRQGFEAAGFEGDVYIEDRKNP